ncbi:hypothetical protein ACHAPM_011666 [Fusarium culmorum]
MPRTPKTPKRSSRRALSVAESSMSPAPVESVVDNEDEVIPVKVSLPAPPRQAVDAYSCTHCIRVWLNTLAELLSNSRKVENYSVPSLACSFASSASSRCSACVSGKGYCGPVSPMLEGDWRVVFRIITDITKILEECRYDADGEEAYVMNIESRTAVGVALYHLVNSFCSLEITHRSAFGLSGTKANTKDARGAYDQAVSQRRLVLSQRYPAPAFGTFNAAWDYWSTTQLLYAGPHDAGCAA